MEVVNRIIELIRNSEKIFITTHENPDGDALGSLTALRGLLLAQGKIVTAAIHDYGPDSYAFLAGRSEILLAQNMKAKPDADIAIVLDSAMLERVGDDVRAILPSAKIVNIDHHYSNNKFGDINWIDDEFSCVGEMMFRLAKTAGWAITPDIAISMYTAICTDTGRFSYANTSSHVLRVAAELVDLGASPREIFHTVYMEKQRSELLLHGRIYASLQTARDGRIAWSVLTKKDFEETGGGVHQVQELVNIPRSLKGVMIAVFFYESGEGRVKASIRAREPFDANVLAGMFGGGGHHRAAGATIFGKIDEVIPKVISGAEKYMSEVTSKQQG